MIRKILKKRRNFKNSMIDPDEIFLDSKNLQNFDRQQFEGRIERPISKKNILVLSILFLSVVGIFGTRLIYLQVQKGEAYFERSENNILEKQIIFGDRGIIYDRNKRELAWNKKVDFVVEPEQADATYTEGNPSLVRAYLSPGFSHMLGYVSYPTKDKSGNYWQQEFIGKDGLEKVYNDNVKGENGAKIIETNALGEIYSENIVNTPKQGRELVTSIDSRIQMQLYSIIKSFSEANSFPEERE